LTIPRKDALKPRPKLGSAARSVTDEKLVSTQQDAGSLQGVPIATDAPADGDVQQYDAALGQWVSRPIVATGGGDVSDPTRIQDAANTTSYDVDESTGNHTLRVPAAGSVLNVFVGSQTFPALRLKLGPSDAGIEMGNGLAAPDTFLRRNGAVRQMEVGSILSLLNETVAPSGQAGHVGLSGVNDALFSIAHQGGISLSFPLGPSTGFVVGKNHLGALVADSGASPFLSDYGLLRGVNTVGTAAGIYNVGSGAYVDFTSAGALGDDAGIEQNNVVMNRASRFWHLTKFALPSTALIRAFIGYTDQTRATMLAADNPAGNYYGLTYSTPRGDTTWKWMRKNNVSQVVTDSGIAVDTGVHYIRFLAFTSAVVVQLMNSSFINQHSASMLSSLPGSGTPLRYVCGCEAQTAAGKTIRFGYAYTMGEN
jgi:hypothetical protein